MNVSESKSMYIGIVSRKYCIAFIRFLNLDCIIFFLKFLNDASMFGKKLLAFKYFFFICPECCFMECFVELLDSVVILTSL